MPDPAALGAVDVVVVGAGVVGAAVARELSRARGVSLAVVDTGDDVGTGTSKANTAILHTGFDASPGTLEATLVARGYQLLGDYADATGIAVERTGAVLVAWDDEQLAALPALAEKARANGVLDTRLLTVDELLAREPGLGRRPVPTGALAVPGESVIDPWSVPLAFAREATANGASFLLGTRLTGVRRGTGGDHVVDTTRGPLRARWLVNAAGLGSGDVDRMLGHDRFTVVPRRGELVVFDKAARSLVSSILLPVPGRMGKGVLVAPTVFGNVLLGPTAEDLDDPTDTATTAAGLATLLGHGRRIVPALVEEEVTAVYAGLRAATEHPDYQVHLDASRHYLCLGGIRSTGLTASLALAEHAAALLREAGLALHPRGDAADPPRMPRLGEGPAGHPRPYRDAALIGTDPAYGQIVCHCERVTRGEIRDATSGSLPASTLDGLRRRTRAGNGRCQGYFCAAELRAAVSPR